MHPHRIRRLQFRPAIFVRAPRPAPALIAALFILAANAFAAVPPNDECSSPTVITGTGAFPFDNSEATTGAEGQESQTCAFDGATGIEQDVWFCWTATCTGIVTIDTCGQTQVDTKIALWPGCACPTEPGAEPRCCDDNACDLQSSITCDVVCGEEYLIQLGSAPTGAPGGTGTFTITCEGEPCPPDLPCCLDFNDQTTMGFAPCPDAPNVDVIVNTPGPSGDPDDYYLETRDLSGGSRACGPPCINDWRVAAEDGCGALCWDYIVIEDSCVPGIPECDENGGWIPITPRMIIQSGTIRAVFRANFFVTDPDGPNPGWHEVCAPIALLDDDGNLPGNEFGAWEMLDGAPNSDWDVLLSNVTEIVLPVEFTSNPAEVSGWDNICLRDDVCPCLEIPNGDIRCEIDADGPTGNYIYTFDLTNLSGVTVQYILLPNDETEPHVIALPSPLPDGDTTTVQILLTGLEPLETYCFDIILADEFIEECCSFRWCVEIPDCECWQMEEWSVECDPDNPGQALLTFSLTNLTPDVVEHLFLFPPLGSGITLTPDYFNVPSLPPFGTTALLQTSIANAPAGEELCILISIHDEDLNECCARELCFIVPECGGVYGPCDLNGDGVVNTADLLTLLAAWGMCEEPPAECPADLDDNGAVDAADLLMLLGEWG
ncbi:MAG: hypothetical protein SYC29_05075 [Planctomycetota bacterium]|nr:hypothetical protein [Planctomycetota bacterium]